ncbi:MAG: radical SAM protein [Bdellovibrionales bacterium]|nr:radical SAM protein [Bdellovibrionales bacterium]
MRFNKLKTFCPLPFTHISSNQKGLGRICCDGYELLKEDKTGDNLTWKNSKSLYEYFNSKSYREVRLKMLKGEKVSHCKYCFQQEENGVQSIRNQFLKEYESEIDDMIRNTDKDGFISHPKITYIDMALGNHCNLKCRMCSPYSSYLISSDWKKMGISFSERTSQRIFEDRYFSYKSTFKMIREALPHVRNIFLTGGEPMLVKEHINILEMIVEEGHAGHIQLSYNSNQTFIPKKLVQIWKHFQKICFNCSVEAYGDLNNYIRYPSRWEKQVKNIYFLDNLANEGKNLELYIHTTLQAYNILKLPDLLDFLRFEKFKTLTRFPFFIWVKIPEWCSPSILPQKLRELASERILDNIYKNEDFFLNYNSSHENWTKRSIQSLKDFCKMITTVSDEDKLKDFVKMTKKHDLLRNQSVLKVLPELETLFV